MLWSQQVYFTRKDIHHYHVLQEYETKGRLKKLSQDGAARQQSQTGQERRAPFGHLGPSKRRTYLAAVAAKVGRGGGMWLMRGLPVFGQRPQKSPRKDKCDGISPASAAGMCAEVILR
ncbi:hypothetical protein COEREDRAFT_81134 [Coemansia reversa NRRL 1564]|uniref:Uncharacterized protein n=1 Tax=Coemansia reversa (strain ATCC 12441 / NRRL 1564) TaxID=763665 RepID=A0A2G5BBR2_COERN|nr:hypothetical protein COEREDRAFT_81134 [Coemansia reversa NRRL 1564]|eukprot:PIA16453.1 hypothetical protein COEREDRAFT_81134 [Coemansia reversa NRRL 1564]